MTTSASRHNEKYHALRNDMPRLSRAEGIRGILESWATASNVVLGHGRPWLDKQIPIFLVVPILLVGGWRWLMLLAEDRPCKSK